MTTVDRDGAAGTAGGLMARHYTHRHTSVVTLDVWMAVEAADHPLSLDEVYDLVRPKLNQAWLMTVVAPRPAYGIKHGSLDTVGLDKVARSYLRDRLRLMVQRGHLVNVGTSTPGGGRYVVSRKPQEPNYVEHERTRTGWREADLERRGASADLHVARFNWHERVKQLLARKSMPAAQVRELLEQAQELMP